MPATFHVARGHEVPNRGSAISSELFLHFVKLVAGRWLARCEVRARYALRSVARISPA